MPLPRELTPGPVKVRRIKLALGCRCELCGRECHPESLEIHAISRTRLRREKASNLEREFLVLCSSCHRDIHHACIPVPEQREILRYRAADTRREIRRILGYTPGPYVPPDSNIPEIFEEAIRVNTYIFGV